VGTLNSIPAQDFDFVDGRTMPRNVPTGTGEDEPENTFGFAYRAIPARVSNKRDSNELVTQVGDLGLTQQKERATGKEAFKSHTDNGGWKVESEEQMISESGENSSTPFPQFEGDVECGFPEQLRDEESGLAGDDESRSKRSNASPRPSGRSSPTWQSDIDENGEAIMERLQKASYAEIKDMLSDPVYADGPKIYVKDRRNTSRRLGGEAATIREQQRKTLCDLCKGMSVETVLRKEGYKHVKDYATLENNAKHYPLCHIFKYIRCP
jgi:hypothetical protein